MAPRNRNSRWWKEVYFIFLGDKRILDILRQTARVSLRLYFYHRVSVSVFTQVKSKACPASRAYIYALYIIGGRRNYQPRIVRNTKNNHERCARVESRLKQARSETVFLFLFGLFGTKKKRAAFKNRRSLLSLRTYGDAGGRMSATLHVSPWG